MKQSVPSHRALCMYELLVVVIVRVVVAEAEYSIHMITCYTLSPELVALLHFV